MRVGFQFSKPGKGVEVTPIKGRFEVGQETYEKSRGESGKGSGPKRGGCVKESRDERKLQIQF